MVVSRCEQRFALERWTQALVDRESLSRLEDKVYPSRQWRLLEHEALQRDPQEWRFDVKRRDYRVRVGAIVATLCDELRAARNWNMPILPLLLSFTSLRLA
jgi:hypothetical protein